MLNQGRWYAMDSNALVSFIFVTFFRHSHKPDYKFFFFVGAVTMNNWYGQSYQKIMARQPLRIKEAGRYYGWLKETTDDKRRQDGILEKRLLDERYGIYEWDAMRVLIWALSGHLSPELQHGVSTRFSFEGDFDLIPRAFQSVRLLIGRGTHFTSSLRSSTLRKIEAKGSLLNG